MSADRVYGHNHDGTFHDHPNPDHEHEAPPTLGDALRRAHPTIDSPLGDLIAGKIDEAEYRQRIDAKREREGRGWPDGPTDHAHPMPTGWRAYLERITLPKIPTTFTLGLATIFGMFAILPSTDRFGFLIGVLTVGTLLVIAEVAIGHE